MNPSDVIIRPLRPDDSLEQITALLHRAYQPLAEMGLRYVATHQTADKTRERFAGSAGCYVAEHEGRIVGTIQWRRGSPDDPSKPPLYQDPNVAIFGQFAVDPSYQRNATGRRLLDHTAGEAARAGCSQLALDTAEPATHLIRWYERLGFRFVQTAQWSTTNYRSVIMSRALSTNQSESPVATL